MFTKKACRQVDLATGHQSYVKSSVYVNLFVIVLVLVVHTLCATSCLLHQRGKSSPSTGKSFSEALILASTNPQYDKRLLFDLPFSVQENLQAQNMLCK